MGMYTEIYVKIALVNDIDSVVIDTLKYMMGMSEQPEKLPDHPLFQTSRFDFMLRCSSHYHVPKEVGEFFWNDIAKQWFLVSRSDFKNYENEAALFFDWIEPYTDYLGKTFVGYTLHEEDDEPTLIYFGDDK